MNPPSVDVKDMLVAALGLVFGSNLFVGKEPATPIRCATVFDTPGSPPDISYDPNYRHYRPSIQVRVRSVVYLDGWTLIDAIKESLHNRVQEVWNGARYVGIFCTQEPALLDWDERNWCRFVTTFDIRRVEELAP